MLTATFSKSHFSTKLLIASISLTLLGISTASSIANDRDKILLGPHIGNATIISIVNINSDNAIVTFRRELEDYVEECARVTPPDKDGVVDSRAIARCVGANNRPGPIGTRRAYCSRNTVYTEIGNYSLLKAEMEEFTGLDGKIIKMMRSDWKDHRNEQLVGNCSACGTPVILDTFKVLCPQAYRAWFGEHEPH